MRIILASKSARRKELLESLNIKFEIESKNTEEKLDENKNHYEECMRTAKEKAKAIFDDIKDDVVVIGSDTIVSFRNKIYGKPQNRLDAFNMIKAFSGNNHEVISSICILVRKNGQVYEELDYDKCIVKVSCMCDYEINNWIDSNDVYSKAGAYAIQEGFGKYIEKIEGDYYSIVGFPLHKVYELLKKYNLFK